jgi:homoserine O-succinyltransferase
MSLRVDAPIHTVTDSSAAPDVRHAGPAVVVGLVNNMPDAALEATEGQFSSLLQAAAGALPVRLRLTYLPQIPRGQAANERLGRHYWTLAALLEDPPDALIVTGAEPVAPELRDEPYWGAFLKLVEWAQRHTVSSIWSCLAAHAAVQHLSGIRRQRLPRKCCGVYEHSALAAHPLTRGIASPLLTPHSRWNDLPLEALGAAGYTILSAGTETGANIFARQVGRSLMVFLQGHPEYEHATLLKEYRRDIGRFVRGQQPEYPNLPHGYFPPRALELLGAFRERALMHRNPEVLADFPAAEMQESLNNTWRTSAVAIYANWLNVIQAAKTRPNAVHSY